METTSNCHRAAPGPWGELECHPTYLDPPEEYFRGSVSRRKTEWFLHGESRASSSRLLEEIGIDPSPLNRDDYWLEAKNGTVIRPPKTFLDHLDPELSNALCARILRSAGDNAHLNEFVIERGRYREYTLGLDIPDDLVAWTEARCFRVGGTTVFASAPHALSRIEDPGLRVRFLKSLARCRSLMVRLRISPGQNLQSIADWWTGGPNRSRALPLLETALATGGVGAIDVLHLLPPVPRRLLNTYALEEDRWPSSSPDCYWAAMNFFESKPSNRFLDDHLPRTYYFQQRFEKVSPPYRFGDVITLFNLQTNRFLHAYVYIADDIVYTKNGSGKFFPYVLMRREDMLTRYSSGNGLTTEAFRLRTMN